MCFLTDIALHAYPEYPMAVRLRTNKNVKKPAIRISAAAATKRFEVARSCPSDAKVVDLEHETFTYSEETVTELNKAKSMYTGSGW